MFISKYFINKPLFTFEYKAYKNNNTINKKIQSEMLEKRF